MRISPFTFLPLALPLLPGTFAANGILYTNSVSYCAEARGVLVDAFEIAYHQANESITFSFSLAPVQGDLNVSANLYVNAYGRDLINETLNICDFLQGVICPLPQVNLTGYGTYPIPSGLVNLPGLAYTVPNLEAFARLQLIRTENQEVAACLQATLSNGKTSRYKSIAIATGIFTLVALLIGLFHSCINSPSPAQYRWFDILYLYQTAVATGLLHLNYPLTFSAFVQNFAWSFGLFHSESMQNSINSMRRKTGGSLTGTAYDEVQYINRRLSPYNVGSSTSAFNFNTISTPAQFQNLLANSPKVNNLALTSRATIPSALFTNDTTGIETGIPVYVNTQNIPPANALTTIFFFFLAFIGIALAFHALLFVVVLIADRGGKRANWATRLRRMWWDFCMGNGLRVCLIWFLPVWIFGFYQFKIGDSGLAIFFAVFAILLTLVPLAVAFVLSILRARKPSSTAPTISPLYTSYRWFHSVGMLYRAYRQKFHFFWFAPLVLAMIARAAFIAFGPASAWAQVIGNVVIELIVLILFIACRPHKDRKGDWLSPILSLCRLIAFGLLIAFIPSLDIDPIVRTIIGIVEFAVFGIPTILLLLGLIWNAGYGYLWRRHTHRIEDGLEVERFVASDGDSQTRAAMAHVDANNFVSGNNGGLGVRNSAYENEPSLARRTSIMEPVDTVYGGHDVPSNTSTVYAQGGNPNGYSEKDMMAVPAAPAAAQDGPGVMGDSRRSSRTSMYYTPADAYYTPSDQPAGQGAGVAGVGAGGGNWAEQRQRDQYFGKY